jgi:hypothetical protein
VRTILSRVRARSQLGAAALLLTLVASCRYGEATPESCHAKYVRDKRGDDTRDTYQACLVRARARAEQLPEDVAQLRARAVFEASCPDVRLTPLDFTGRLVTLVGAEGCGRRLIYKRQLRRHLFTRSARNSPWVVVADSVAPPVTNPLVQVNATTNVMMPAIASGASPVVSPAPTGAQGANPYADP